MKRGELAAAVGEAGTTAASVEAAKAAVDAARARLGTALAARQALGTAHLLALADRHIAHHRHRLDAAIVAHAIARDAHAGKLAAIDERRGRLTAARADKALIERHFARWRETQQKLAERREE